MAVPASDPREAYDRLHKAVAGRNIQFRLRAEAWGDEFPAEVDPASSCTWSVLGAMISWLRLKPGDMLVDLGCGRGGTGLWLARAFSARLIGVDFSPVGLAAARQRIPDFLPGGGAEFVEGTFEQTGLPDACADGVVSMDALPFSPDRDAALVELRRILRPGARAVFTGAHKLPEHPDYDPSDTRWTDRIRAAGFELDAVIERPEEPKLWERLYALLEENEAEVRAELGDERADVLYGEARGIGRHIYLRAPELYVVRAPA